MSACAWNAQITPSKIPFTNPPASVRPVCQSAKPRARCATAARALPERIAVAEPILSTTGGRRHRGTVLAQGRLAAS